MTKSILRKYAKLIVQMGVNIKKGQGAVILADTAQSEIALMVAEEATAPVRSGWTSAGRTRTLTRCAIRKKV